MTETKTHTLSKSDFKIAKDCPQKLLYKKNNYPSNNEGNDFLQTLAEGGYIVGKMAQVMYEHFAKENGYACHEFTSKDKQQYALESTELRLKDNEKVVLFEPAFKVGQKIIRIDILIKNGNHFQILEVKAKSHDSGNGEEEDEKKTNPKKNLKEYIEDVAYQKMVLSEWLKEHANDYPNPKIDTYLFMPDKSRHTQIDNLVSWFEISDRFQIGNFNSIEVSFMMPGKEKELWEAGNSILQKLDVGAEVDALMEEIINHTNDFLTILSNGHVDDREGLISKKCFACEFKNPDNPGKDGYGQCLGKRAYAENHISELYFGSSIGGNATPLINSKIKVNKPLTIFDYDISDFKKSDGNIGSRNERQIIQYINTKENKEFFHENMADYLSDWKFPLHFIDFETITCAIPHHKGMRPYETIAFQWSCHTIKKPGDEPKHSEWINTEPTFPNFLFAESLMKQIGTSGTPLMWATHENSVLKAILGQLENADQYQPGYRNESLKNWLLDITKRKDEKGKVVINQGRLIDMNEFTLKNYFHPYMKGKTSIKRTLPAVWNHNAYLHDISYFKPYYKLGEDGHVLNPYETLKYHWDEIEFEEAEINETVKEGSAAMRAYQEMMFGKGIKDNQIKDRLKQELLNYCKLDTMAMIIIWKHWITKLNINA